MRSRRDPELDRPEADEDLPPVERAIADQVELCRVAIREYLDPVLLGHIGPRSRAAWYYCGLVLEAERLRATIDWFELGPDGIIRRDAQLARNRAKAEAVYAAWCARQPPPFGPAVQPGDAAAAHLGGDEHHQARREDATRQGRSGARAGRDAPPQLHGAADRGGS